MGAVNNTGDNSERDRIDKIVETIHPLFNPGPIRGKNKVKNSARLISHFIRGDWGNISRGRKAKNIDAINSGRGTIIAKYIQGLDGVVITTLPGAHTQTFVSVVPDTSEI